MKIELLVNEDLTLSARGWEKAEQVADLLNKYVADPTSDAGWAFLFNQVFNKLKGDEDAKLFFISIARKIAIGEITPSKDFSEAEDEIAEIFS